MGEERKGNGDKRRLTTTSEEAIGAARKKITIFNKFSIE